MSKDIQEEIIVLFHAALVGRADVVQVSGTSKPWQTVPLDNFVMIR
jgi:hypothetical protein